MLRLLVLASILAVAHATSTNGTTTAPAPPAYSSTNVCCYSTNVARCGATNTTDVTGCIVGPSTTCSCPQTQTLSQTITFAGCLTVGCTTQEFTVASFETNINSYNAAYGVSLAIYDTGTQTWSPGTTVTSSAFLSSRRVNNVVAAFQAGLTQQTATAAQTAAATLAATPANFATALNAVAPTITAPTANAITTPTVAAADGNGDHSFSTGIIVGIVVSAIIVGVVVLMIYQHYTTELKERFVAEGGL